MQFTQDAYSGKYYIRAYEAGKIKINDEIFTNSLIVTPNQLIDPWSPQSFKDLIHDSWLPIIALQPKIVLFGSGAQLQFPSPALLAPFYENKIGIEIMDTHAACRTYNLLVSEGRKVVAALLVN